MKKSILVGFVFLIFGLFTLPHYGINWDTINHLPRGQVYLHYFLTGRKDFTDLPKFVWYWQKDNTLRYVINESVSKVVPRVSLYQNAGVDFKWYMANDGYGHPPISDILSAFFNYILFQKTGIVNDIDSYRIYGVFLASCLVGLIYWWVSKKYNSLAGFIAALTLATYPLFWAESHFNTEKDIPETVYWSFLLFAIWNGVTKKSLKWLLLSGVLFGLALGTKFNILFVPFVIIPWILFYLFKQRKITKRKDLVKVFSGGLIAILVGFSIFILFWPYLWPDPIGRVGNIIRFYKDIGETSDVDKRFLGIFGINTYPIEWIIYTTIPTTLFLAIVGLVSGIKKIFEKNGDVILIFYLWLIVPILRVTWPEANSYGGVRQLMEYIPALSIFAGIGASFIVNKFKLYKLKIIYWGVIGATVFSVIYPNIKIHPNENVYANFLIGGLAGEKEKDIPNWGFNFGAAYRQAATWINKNAEKDAKVVFAFELLPNIPKIWFRTDIQLVNSYRSGYLRQGEYAVTLIYRSTDTRSYYDMYLDKFLEPVYEVKVDGVAILKVWKNDDAHLKNPWNEKAFSKVAYKKTTTGMTIDFGQIRDLSRLEINYKDTKCQKMKQGYFYISEDNKNWTRLPGVLPEDWAISSLGEQPKNGKFIEPFVAQHVRYINFIVEPLDSCLMNVTGMKAFYLIDSISK